MNSPALLEAYGKCIPGDRLVFTSPPRRVHYAPPRILLHHLLLEAFGHHARIELALRIRRCGTGRFGTAFGFRIEHELFLHRTIFEVLHRLVHLHAHAALKPDIVLGRRASRNNKDHPNRQNDTCHFSHESYSPLKSMPRSSSEYREIKNTLQSGQIEIYHPISLSSNTKYCSTPFCRNRV